MVGERPACAVYLDPVNQVCDRLAAAALGGTLPSRRLAPVTLHQEHCARLVVENRERVPVNEAVPQGEALHFVEGHPPGEVALLWV